MISQILPWLLGLVGLGIMAFIHELGHFVAAKINGVAVEVFALGWGPKMIGFTHGGTTYQISWLPIGGYCKMKGELVPGIAGGAAESVAIASESQPVPREAREKGSFLAAAPWQRIVIAAFGPLFNLVCALAIFTVISLAGFDTRSADNRIVLQSDYTLHPYTSPPPATEAGLKSGDRIVAIDGAPVQNFQEVTEKVSGAPGRKLIFSVVRSVSGSLKTLSLLVTPVLDKSSGAARIGIYAWVDPVVDTVDQGSTAAIQDLRKGDRIVSVNDRPVPNTIALSQELVARPTKIIVGYERAGVPAHVTLVPEYGEKVISPLGINFASLTYHSPSVGFAGAVSKSVGETWNTVVLTVKGIGLLFQGIKVRNAVAGPLRIIYYIGTVATNGGAVPTFQLVAFLSVVLFLMNLLPIPATDGGQILLFLIETIRGKPLRAKLIWRMQIIGFSILITLLVFALLADGLFFAGR